MSGAEKTSQNAVGISRSWTGYLYGICIMVDGYTENAIQSGILSLYSDYRNALRQIAIIIMAGCKIAIMR